jgi:hypothetical protein
MKRLPLSRRAVLRGAGGVGLALPLLERMLDGRAFAQTAPPKRYIVVFDGQSLGGDGDPLHNDFVPNTVGRNYDLKSALAPLGTLGVRDQVSVVSGLKILTSYENGGTVPAGGRRDDFHVSSLSPLLSGVRSGSSTASMGPTSDQLVAKVIAGNTTFPSFVCRAQAEWYLSVSAPYGRDMISYRADAQGRPVAIPPQTSPQQAFQQLFGNFTPSGVDPAAAKILERTQRARRSVLDLVHRDTEKLLPTLGAADRQRLSRHFDELRDLERRVAAIPPPASGTCQVPPSPGADPALGGAQGTDSGGNNTYSQNLGYSGEEERARAFCDLIHMAVACDLTRVASMQITMFQSHMNMNAVTGQATDCHELGHGGIPGPKTLNMSKGIAWHVKHFAYLVSKLKGTPEGNGTLLDNSALVFLLEGGHGNDYSSTSGPTPNSSHSTENMACLIAGYAGGLKPGQHLVATGKHPANVLITAMLAAGYGQATLGEVSGDLPALRT